MENLTYFLWIAHFLLLFVLSIFSMKKSYVYKIIILIYCFYSIAVLIPFNFDFYYFDVIYKPTAIFLTIYIFTDFAALIFMYLCDKNPVLSKITINKMGLGCKTLLILACMGQMYEFIQTSDLIFLPKDKYIIASTARMKDLFVYHLPYDTIILGGVFFSPFRSRIINFIVLFIFSITLITSLICGYRHLLFLLFAYIVFLRRNKLTTPIAVAFLLTFIGEISNYFKVYIHTVLLSNIHLLSYIKSIMHNYTFQPTREQMAILSNLVLSYDYEKINSSLVVFANLLPFKSLFVEANVQLNSLGIMLNIPFGQGAAYNFQLFVLSTWGIGILFLGFTILLNLRVQYTLLSFVFLCLSYSMLRDEPSFWLSQIKVGIFLMLFVEIINKLEILIRYSNLNTLIKLSNPQADH